MYTFMYALTGMDDGLDHSLRSGYRVCCWDYYDAERVYTHKHTRTDVCRSLARIERYVHFCADAKQ